MSASIKMFATNRGNLGMFYIPYSTNVEDYMPPQDAILNSVRIVTLNDGNFIKFTDDFYTIERISSDSTYWYSKIEIYYKKSLVKTVSAMKIFKSDYPTSLPTFNGYAKDHIVNQGNIVFTMFEDSSGTWHLSLFFAPWVCSEDFKSIYNYDLIMPKIANDFSIKAQHGDSFSSGTTPRECTNQEYWTRWGNNPTYYNLSTNYINVDGIVDEVKKRELNPDPAHTEDTSDLNNIGGDGNDTNNSDAIDYPDDTGTLNANNAVNAGFITLYNPTKGQLQSLASYLWTSDFVDNIKKLFGNPMDVIIGLNQVPVTVSSSTSQTVKAGFIDTGVTMNVCDAQYIEKDLGYFTQKLYWGSCLDFDPNTKVQIYLPFIGVRPLNVNDVMGTTLHLKYRIDILTGQCVAWLKCGTSVKYEWSGHCANTIPLTASNWAQIFQSAVGLATTVGTGIAVGVATGGASVPETIGLASSSLSQASNMKPTIERSGSMGGSASIMGMKKAFLIIQRPSTSLPKNYGKLYGYASNKTRQLSTLTGFTQVEHVNLSTSYATEEEYLEIVSMLKEGVIL